MTPVRFSNLKTTSATALRTTLALFAAALLCLVLAAPASAAKEHTFDPQLSLRGDCSVSALDEVPDPGLCPMPPGVAGVDHPPQRFDEPCGVATDRHGYIYVSSRAENSGEGRIDIFNAQGEYLTQVKDSNRPCELAVDSQGNLYVAEEGNHDAVLFKPKAFPPVKGSEYEAPLIVREFLKGGPTVTPEESCKSTTRFLAVDPADDHLYATGCGDLVFEHGSAAEGNPLLAEHDSEGQATRLNDIAIHGQSHDIYASGTDIEGGATGSGGEGDPKYARGFIFDGADGQLKCEADGSETPQGGFGVDFGNADIAVDQSNGDLYFADVVNDAIHRFDSDCGYAGQVVHPFSFEAVIAFDAPYPGQPGYESPNQGYLYAAQYGASPNQHRLYAFAPVAGEPEPPEVREQAVASVTETEALLRAELNPKAKATTYRFQYTTQAAFEEHGYEGASSVPVPAASAGSDAFFKAVSAPISGLLPDTAYRFRAVATSHCVEAEPEVLCTTTGEGVPGEEGEDAAFATYGPEAGLPDGRAYELVSPPDTGGLIPMFGINPAGEGFPTAFVSADGESVAFGTEGGSLPGLEGNGYHDIYKATRGPGGWQTAAAGLNGAQGSEPFPGGIAPDHRYSFWAVESGGTLAKGGYLRGPDGVEPIGIGSLGVDLRASGRWIGAAGEHIVFVGGGQLEPEAPVTQAIYERSADGPTEVLSLLPGDVTPTGEAEYKGTSADGTATAFRVEGDLYLRLGGAETKLVAEGSEQKVGNAAEEPTFGGVSAGGERVAYLRPNPAEPRRPNPATEGGGDTSPGPPQGEIFSYDTEAEEAQQVPSGDQAVLVHVSRDGSHVYFLSPELLDGEAGQAGAENLYAWDAASEAVRHIATVTERDVYGERGNTNTNVTDGLGLWVDYVADEPTSSNSGPGAVPARSSADGSVLLFASRAELTAYDNAGQAEIYRYDANAGELSCLSCTPTGVPAGSDASLQSPAPPHLRSLPPVIPLAEVRNITPDGERVLFQSGEPLVVGDTDGLQDVYQWQAPGKGSCTEQSPAYQPASEGCLALISSGQSAGEDYLYGMSADGSGVVFLSGDLLSFEDLDATPSLYDARIGGGFAPPGAAPGECLGEACQPAVLAPEDPTPASLSYSGAGSVGEGGTTKPRCPKGKHRVRKAGKTRCLKRARCPKGKRRVRKAGKTRCLKRPTKKAQRKRHTSRKARR